MTRRLADQVQDEQTINRITNHCSTALESAVERYAAELRCPRSAQTGDRLTLSRLRFWAQRKGAQQLHQKYDSSCLCFSLLTLGPVLAARSADAEGSLCATRV